MSMTIASAAPPQSLAQRGAVALGWGVFASAAKILLTLGVQAALARLLSPSDFGLFAIGMLVVGLAAYFADIGLATSLVQKAEIEDADVRFVFTMNLAISLAVALLLLAFAGPLAAAFGKPEAAAIFRAMAPVFVLNAAASVSVSLLRRSLDYRRIQLAALVAYIAGFGVVGIAIAMWQGTVAALVAAFAVQSLVNLLLLYAGTRHSLRLSLAAPGRGAHLEFGFTVLATNVVNWLVSTVDRLLIGRLFATAALGLYTAAYNLVHAPVNVLYPNLQSVVFAATARLQGQTARLAAAYLELLQGVTVLALPAFAGVFFLAQPLVLTIYGPTWADAAAFVATFSVMAPFLLVWGISTPFLWNGGRKSTEALVQLPFIALAVAAMLAASRVSLVAVAWTAVALFVARTMLMVVLVTRTLQLPLTAVLRRLLPALLLAVWVAAATGATGHLLADATVPPALQLAAGLATISAALLAGLLLVPTSLPPLVRTALSRWQHLPFVGALARRLMMRNEA